MSITKELRELTTDPLLGYASQEVHAERLLAIADRIDAEHERQLEVLYRDMSDAGWVRLPKDADGEVIHIGDRVENNKRVVRIVLTDGSWEPSVYIEESPNILHEYFCNEVSHHHAQTVEDVLREFADGIKDQNADFTELAIAEYAKRLKLAEGENA